MEFNIWGKANSVDRDSRRRFTLSQQKQILHKQHNKCAKCGKSLDIIVAQFDHIKPWAKGGKTTVANGRALHANCHMRVTHQKRLRNTDKRRKSKSNNDPLGLNSVPDFSKMDFGL